MTQPVTSPCLSPAPGSSTQSSLCSEERTSVATRGVEEQGQARMYAAGSSRVLTGYSRICQLSADSLSSICLSCRQLRPAPSQPAHLPLAHLCPVHPCQSEQVCPLSQAAPGTEWPGPRAEARCTHPASSATHLGAWGGGDFTRSARPACHLSSSSVPLLLWSPLCFLEGRV